MSQISASSQPPPSAKPETAATSGVLIAATRRQKEAAGWRSASSKLRSLIALMSAPAAKTSSEPAMTMQRTSGSGSSRSSSLASCSIISGERALRASGRFSRSRATWPSSEVSTSSATPYSATIGVIALIPVAARPMISFWICEVPS